MSLISVLIVEHYKRSRQPSFTSNFSSLTTTESQMSNTDLLDNRQKILQSNITTTNDNNDTELSDYDTIKD